MTTTNDRARALMTRRHQTIKHRQQTLLCRSTAIMSLGNTAVDHYSRIQGKLDPSISQGCSPSGVALS
ncbi:MAG: hypothetical protein AAGF75_06335 [Cyanobacteria bacterium P01_H01_bin.130]